MDPRDDRSFRLDRSARSFVPSDFGLGDVPWMVIGMAVFAAAVAVLAYLLDWVGQWLPPEVRPVILGLVVGFVVGLRVSDWAARRSRRKLTERCTDSDLRGQTG